MTLLSAQTLGSALTTAQGQFFHEDIFGGVNTDTLLGAAGDDRILEGAGADSIDGGTGADTLNGGSGGDTLIGGSGIDWFDSDGFGEGAFDVINDFEASGDVIDLDTFFATIADVVAATKEMPAGSIVIDLSRGAGPDAPQGGSLKVLNTTKS